MRGLEGFAVQGLSGWVAQAQAQAQASDFVFLPPTTPTLSHHSVVDFPLGVPSSASGVAVLGGQGHHLGQLGYPRPRMEKHEAKRKGT